MMTHELEVSIVAAPLEAIDRRALSQAWYSALHRVVARARLPIERARQCGLTKKTPFRTVSHRTCGGSKPYRYNKCAVRSVRRGSFAGEAAAGRTRTRSILAARIARAFAAASVPKRATFSLGRGNARVHVVLQTTAARTMLVALCPPELCADVGSALAQARAALAARGIALDLRKLGGHRCS